MIAKLRGNVDTVGEDWLILDVGGVGYLLSCSARTLGKLPPVGETVSLMTEMHIREDQVSLYGFVSQVERDWFRLLTMVQGVGAKVALAILSVLTADQLIQAIGAQDKAMLTRANGVGPKLAARILNELKEKVGQIALKESLASGGANVDVTLVSVKDGQDGIIGDAISALVNLGYGRAEAYSAVAQAMRGFETAPAVGTLIRAGLKELSATVKEGR